MKRFILKYFTYPLKGKSWLNGKLFTDGGNPIFTYAPIIVYPSWCGLSIYLFGREFNIRK